MVSPYLNIPVENWEAKTLELIKQHPLDSNEIFQVVMGVWDEMLQSSITSRGYKIGQELFPNPQIIGSLLHELIPLELSSRYPHLWRREQNATEKDLIYIPDDRFSIEIKTSSSPRSTFGNRSYAQESVDGNKTKKDKSGYYLVVNFQKITKQTQAKLLPTEKPKVNLVRFGWIDKEDWQGQQSQTGQQAKLSPDVERFKLLKLPLSN
jgi:hypothetical protein